MRKLTQAEQAIMNEAIRPFWIERDGLLPKEQRAFKRGFTAGLDHAASEVERLQAENARLRAELLQTRRKLTGWARAWKKEASGHYCQVYNRERGKTLNQAADDIMRLVKGLRLCAIFGR